MSKQDDGGPAFPNPSVDTDERHYWDGQVGMSLRDWFAGTMQEDDRLVKCIRAMDDEALECFAFAPDTEREEWLTETEPTQWLAMGSEVDKVVRRLEIEAHAIARVRYMQADAMLVVRKK